MAYLFFKPPKLPPNTNSIAMNVTEISSKIVEPDIYKEAIRNFIHVAYWKETICIELETFHLNNTLKLVDLPARHKIMGSK